MLAGLHVICMLVQVLHEQHQHTQRWLGHHRVCLWLSRKVKAAKGVLLQ
jgi:hypothetical protein